MFLNLGRKNKLCLIKLLKHIILTSLTQMRHWNLFKLPLRN